MRNTQNDRFLFEGYGNGFPVMYSICCPLKKCVGCPANEKEIDVLNKLYSIIGTCGGSLEGVGKNIRGFKKISNAKTADNYQWFWAMHFELDNKKAAVLFPWAMDWSNMNGSGLDRSILIFAENNDREFASFIARQLIDQFWGMYFYDKSLIRLRADTIPDSVFARKLDDGRKVIPRWYVETRAYLNPVSGGDPLQSWLAAENWFLEQGFEIC